MLSLLPRAELSGEASELPIASFKRERNNAPIGRTTGQVIIFLGDFFPSVAETCLPRAYHKTAYMYLPHLSGQAQSPRSELEGTPRRVFTVQSPGRGELPNTQQALPNPGGSRPRVVRKAGPTPWEVRTCDGCLFSVQDTRLGVATTLGSAVAAMCVQLVDASDNLAIHMLSRI